MRRRAIDFGVGLGLLLGPLGYALTLPTEVVEVAGPTETVTVVVASADSSEPAEPEVPLPPSPDSVAPSEAEPTPSPSAPTTDLGDRLQFAFVNEAGIVLDTDARRGWGRGRLVDHAGPGQFRAAKRADVAKLPESHVLQRGRSFDVYGPAGKVCTARLGELAVLAQHDGPSLFELYNGSMDDVVWTPADGGENDYDAFGREVHPDQEIRANVWASLGVDGNRAWLVAPLVSDTSCEGGLWARDAERPPPKLLHRATSPTAATAARIATFHGSSELAETRSRYEQWRDGQADGVRESVPAWREHAREHAAKVQEWSDANGATRMVELEFGRAGEGCGDPSATEMSRLDFVVDGAFESTCLGTGPLAAFDADLDGRYELLYGTTLVSDTAALRGDVSRYEVFYCPC